MLSALAQKEHTKKQSRTWLHMCPFVLNTLNNHFLVQWVIDLSREPTFVILDTGRTRSMGSRHAVNRLMHACSKQEPNLIWFKTVPCRSMFTFANGETSAITQRLVMYFARSNGSFVSTTIDILDIRVRFRFCSVFRSWVWTYAYCSRRIPYLPEAWSKELSVVRINFRPYHS